MPVGFSQSLNAAVDLAIVHDVIQVFGLLVEQCPKVLEVDR